MQISFHGAARQVTGSRYVLRAAGLNIMIDCGMFQEREHLGRNWAPFDPAPDKIDVVVLTHAHLDHCGLLPRLVAQGFRGKIHTTEPSVPLAKLIMNDSARIQEEDAAYKVVRHQRENRTPARPVVPLYRSDDALAAGALLKGHPYHEPVELGPGITATFFEAGHILGSSSVLIDVREKNKRRRVLFSGDVGQWHKPLIRDPEPAQDADYIVMESTYGTRTHNRSVDIQTQLEEAIRPALERGGTVIIPTFALERAQELVYHLGALHRDKRLPAVKAFLDSPMAADVTDIFHDYSDYLDQETMKVFHSGQAPLRFPGFRYTRTAQESRAINQIQGPKIIMATSGMCEAGRIKHHLRQYISDPRSLILFCGYQAPATLGQVIQSGLNPVRIHGQMYPVKAQIAELVGMSAHGDRDDLLHWLSSGQKTPVRQVFLTHGEASTADGLAKTVTERFGWPAVAPDLGHTQELD